MFVIAYKGACGKCSKVAQVIEDESGHLLSVRTIDSLREEFLLDVPSEKPSLIEFEDGLIKKVYTGSSMSMKILRLVGPQKSVKIFSALASEVGKPSVSRRLTLTGLVAATGLALTGMTWSPAVADDTAVSADESVKLYNAVTKHKKFKVASVKAQADGYLPEKSEYVILRQKDGFLFFYFMEHAQRPTTDAAVISCFIKNETYDFSLEYLSGTTHGVSTASNLNQALTITRPSQYEKLPMGPAEYFGCVSFCVGANCGLQAARCRFLIHMAAVLACMTAVCGSKVRTCHNVCRHTW